MGSLRETLLTLAWLLSTPLLATPRPRPPSRSTHSRCVMLRPRSTMSPWPSLLLLMPRSPVTAGPLPCRMAWRKLEVELGQLNADLDEMTNEAKMSEDKAARAMVDAARLADELRCEQELAMNLEKDKKLLEAQCKDAATRADEAEVNALKGGRKAMIKMETRIRELESELDAETRRFGDVNKNLRKSERSIKELTFAADEDRKNHERMQSLIDQLQGKVKSYKKQIEEAEEIAALNLAKYRKVAGALGDAEASADANEQAMAMRKARAKSASLGL